VIAVPTTGHSAAQGYSEVSGIPYGDGLYKNQYVGRTFIQPSQSLRDRGVKLKLNPLPDSIRGKRLIVVDDSIVRGTTTKQIVLALREAGATEVHIRITCPPVRWPCFYGIDMPTRQELIGADLAVEEIRAYVGADSLGYLSLDGMVAAAGAPKGSFCRACFDGEYPIDVPDRAGKFVLEDQLRLPTG
jgi:amidophosphoribosyltransferase